MLTPFIGPKQQWEAELEKVSHSGLVWLAGILLDHRLLCGFSNVEQVRKTIAEAKRTGKSEDAHRAWMRITADPEKAYRSHLKRSKAAKRAARAWKRERKA